MLQSVMWCGAANKESNQNPDGLDFPLKRMRDLDDVEEKLSDSLTKSA